MCHVPSKRKTADVTLSTSHEIFRISVPVYRRKGMWSLLERRFVAHSCSMVRFTYFSVQWKIKYILNPSIWSDERHWLHKIFLFQLHCAFYVCLEEHRSARPPFIQYASRRRRFYFLADTMKPKCKRWNFGFHWPIETTESVACGFMLFARLCWFLSFFYGPAKSIFEIELCIWF